MQLRTSLIGAFTAIQACAAQPAALVRNLHLLAATPTAYRAGRYPATLYSANGKQGLRTVRTVVRGSEGVQFLLDGPTFLAIGEPSPTTNKITFIHYEAPMRPDSVEFGTTITVQTHPPLGAFLLKDRTRGWTIGLSFFKNGGPYLSGITASLPEGSERVIDSVHWSELENIQFNGSMGGADIGFGTVYPTLAPHGLYVHSPQGEFFIARLKTPAIAESEVPATTKHMRHLWQSTMLCLLMMTAMAMGTSNDASNDPWKS